MNPTKVERARVKNLTDLPNIGKGGEKDLIVLGITSPEQLIGRDAYATYEELYDKTGARHDPCVIDVFLSITRFMDGETPRPWWNYTEERKRDFKIRSKSW